MSIITMALTLTFRHQGHPLNQEKFCLSKERNTDNIKLINNRPRKFGPINKTKIFGPIIIDQFISPNFAWL